MVREAELASQDSVAQLVKEDLAKIKLGAFGSLTAKEEVAVKNAQL